MAASKAKRRVVKAPVEVPFAVEKDVAATVRVQWPSGPVDVCAAHVKHYKQLAKHMGLKAIAYEDAPRNVLCGMCRAEKRNARQRGSKWHA